MRRRAIVECSMAALFFRRLADFASSVQRRVRVALGRSCALDRSLTIKLAGFDQKR
jgi:hypothetical protein